MNNQHQGGYPPQHPQQHQGYAPQPHQQPPGYPPQQGYPQQHPQQQGYPQHPQQHQGYAPQPPQRQAPQRRAQSDNGSGDALAGGEGPPDYYDNYDPGEAASGYVETPNAVADVRHWNGIEWDQVPWLDERAGDQLPVGVWPAVTSFAKWEDDKRKDGSFVTDPKNPSLRIPRLKVSLQLITALGPRKKSIWLRRTGNNMVRWDAFIRNVCPEYWGKRLPVGKPMWAKGRLFYAVCEPGKGKYADQVDIQAFRQHEAATTPQAPAGNQPPPSAPPGYPPPPPPPGYPPPGYQQAPVHYQQAPVHYQHQSAPPGYPPPPPGYQAPTPPPAPAYAHQAPGAPAYAHQAPPPAGQAPVQHPPGYIPGIGQTYGHTARSQAGQSAIMQHMGVKEEDLPF